jgi:hypothetical protein
MGLKLCVEDCDKASSSRSMVFIGELAATLSPTQQLIEGGLKMMGKWENAFGLDFLHVTHAQLSVGMDTKLMMPSKLEGGGALCIGSQESCGTNSSSSNDNMITGSAFVGVDATNPADNFVMAMLSEVSIDKILGILGDTVNEKFSFWRTVIPPPLKDSGIFPMNAACFDGEKTNPTRKDCYASLSFSPVAARMFTTSYGDVSVDQGAFLSGRLNFLGWNIKVNAKIKVKGVPVFYIDAAMSPLELGGVLKIGKSMTDMTSGPRFFVDLGETSPLAAAVMIKGGYSVEALLLGGETSIRIGKDGFELKENRKVLGFESNFTLGWTWDMKNFLIQGQYRMQGAGTIISTLIPGVFKLVKRAYMAGKRAVTKVMRGALGAQAAVGFAKSIAKSVCESMEGTRATMCHKAVGMSMASAKTLFTNAKKMSAKKFVQAKEMVRKLPTIALAKVGVDALALLNPNSTAIEAMNKVLKLNQFDYSLALDGGNLDANMVLDAVALGKPVKLIFTAKINQLDAIIKRIFSKGLGFFKGFSDKMKAAAKKIVFAAAKESRAQLNEAKKKILDKVQGMMSKMDAAGDAVDNAKEAAIAMKAKTFAAKQKAHAAASKMKSLFSQRRRRRKWFLGESDEAELDVEQPPFEYGSDEYVSAIVDEVLKSSS